MNTLEKIVREGKEGEQVLFRRGAYTRQSQEELLRDVVSLANANVEGERVIILGVEAGVHGATIFDIPREAIDGTHRYHGVIRDFIEPPLNMLARSLTVDGKHLVALILDDCQDKPYMMRADHSERLRRGDAWIRVKTENQRMGRRQLEAVFADRFAEALYTGKVEVGFDGNMLSQEMTVNTADAELLPSKDAKEKLTTLIEAKEQKGAIADENTFITRLTHARLFGADQPYQSHSVSELRKELDNLVERYRDHDDYFRFEQHGQKVNLALVNQSEQELKGASIALMVPRASKFLLARRAPVNPANELKARKVYDDESSYPTVSELEKAYQVTENLGNVAPGQSLLAFKEPLRLFADKSLAGQKVTLFYKLYGRNLRQPISGKLFLKLV